MSAAVTTPLPAALADARAMLDAILFKAISGGVSDVHAEPTAEGYEIRYRQDGILATAMALPADAGRSVVLRLMVLAKLLTYRLDVPQEGRGSVYHDGNEIELRISIMPTIHGLRAAMRLPAANRPRGLEELGLDRGVLLSLQRFARADTGMLIVTGPAGSGKTTTIYALLDYLTKHAADCSIVSLEDPVERAIAGVTQIEVKPFGQLTYEKALRSILRQDPQILVLGEIRDAATAAVAMQAAMTGHRLITTLHASTAAGAISRLLEMGLEPYQITSALWGVLAQRLVCKLDNSRDVLVAKPSATTVTPRLSGKYHGRTAVGEMLLLDPDLRRAILSSADVSRIEEVAAMQTGFVPLRAAGEKLVERGITDAAEITRIFGEGEMP